MFSLEQNIENFQNIMQCPACNSDIYYDNNILFIPTKLGSYLSRLITQITIALTIGNEGGFFVMIGKKK